MLVLKTGTGPTPCRTALAALILFAWPLVATAADGTQPAIDPQQEGWPWYRGPFGNGSAIECGEPLVRDMTQARLVWRSEDWIPNAGGTIRGGGGISNGKDGGGPYLMIKGSCSSPVMQDGKIFVYYYMASEDPVVLGRKKKKEPGINDKTAAKLSQLPMEITEEDYLRYVFNIHGDDVLHCFDAETGKTLWRTAVPGGLNLQAYTYGPHLTPTVNRGKAFAIGSTGRIICCDAKTGKLLWVNEETGLAQGGPERIAEAVVQKELHGVNHQRYEIAVAVDGVVALRDWCRRGGLCGIDAATGKTIWKGVGGGTWMLIPWKAGGKWYLLSGATCIDPLTGKVLWSEKGHISGTGTHVAVADDILVCSFQKGRKQSQAQAYRISPAGAEPLWQTEESFDAIHGLLIHRGVLYSRTKSKPADWPFTYCIVCLDLETGEVLGRLGVVPKGKSHGNGTLFTAEGGLMPWRGHGSFCKTRLLDLDPKSGGETGEWAGLDYDSSHTMIMHRGRMYFRGQNHLYCYDLRAKR